VRIHKLIEIKGRTHRRVRVRHHGAPTARVDRHGVIVDVNRAWTTFAQLNGGTPDTTGPGVDYLAECDRAAARGSADGARFVDGVRAVLAGSRGTFEFAYSCDSPTDAQRFRAIVTPTAEGGALIRHELLAREPRPRATPTPPVVLLVGPANDVVDTLEVALVEGFGDDTVVGRAEDLDSVPAFLGAVTIDAVLVAGAAPPSRADIEGLRARHPTVAFLVLAVGAEVEELIAAGAQEILDPDEITAARLRRSVVHAVARTRRSALQERLAHILHSSSEVVLLFDANRELRYLSPAAAQVLGWGERDIADIEPGDNAHPEDRPRIRTALRELIAMPERRQLLECRIRHGEGHWMWVRISARNLLGDPAVRGIVLHLRDITAEREATDALRLQADLLEAAGQPIIALAADGAITTWNAAAARTYGWSREEVMGRHVLDVLPTDPWGEREQEALRSLSAGEVYAGEYRIQRRDGEWLPVIITDTPVMNADGSLASIISVATDLTERRRVEAHVDTLSHLVESSNDAIISLDTAGRVTGWNRAASELYEIPFGLVAGSRLDRLGGMRFTDEATEHELASAIDEALRGGVPPLHFAERVRSSGDRVHIASAVSSIRGADGSVMGASIIARDVTELVELRRTAVAEHERLAAAQRMAHIGSFEVDTSTGAVLWSEELYRIWSRTLDTQIDIADYVRGTHPDDRAEVVDAMERSRTEDEPVDMTHRIIRDDGELRWVHVRYQASYDSGRRIVSGTVRDVTEAKVVEEQLAHQALHDPLTHLPNRLLVFDRLTQAIRRSARSLVPITVLFIDVDRFKMINDGLGHAGGDTALVEIARRMQHVLRPTDTLARVGGDEFVVVAEDLETDEEALDLAERLAGAVSRVLHIDLVEMKPTISIGVARGKAGSSADSLMLEADAAMYRAKRRGRNRVELHDDDSGQASRRLVLASALRRAIDTDQVRLAYQPIVDLGTGRVAGVEALARWTGPDGHEHSPEEFIGVAEECGLMVPLGAAITRRALREFSEVRAGRASLEDLWLSINLSAKQLVQSDLAKWLRSELRAVGMSARRLHFEITETALMEDYESAVRTLTDLRALGVQLAIDDFGTGYSSLAYARRLPVAAFKIDQSFVQGLDVDDHDSGIVEAIVALGRALGLQIVAEGVETMHQRERLQDLGCQFAQGHLFSPALEPDALVEWLTSRTA
jgi:diguanylate cyclase (GGDEF)-like protein/PAS domain S-box-containing protein